MIADRFTRQALQRLYLRSERVRLAAWPDADAQAESRTRAGTARQRVLDHLPDYLELLEQNCSARGIIVHWADGAQEANRIVVEVVRASGGQAMRNHSPLLDEIAVDVAAEANDIELTRVHLGDHIVQVVGRPIQHPIWPTAHLRLADISVAVQDAWHVPLSYDPDILASTVRNRLRPQLFAVSTALLGLNFAVAEAGTLVCLDNDGHNPSLASFARHVICLLSIEQVVADMIDLDVLITAYARSAWGAPLPAFVTEINGPTRTPAGDMQEIHLILVDNNRSDALAQGFGEALRCIQCGACHNVCPIFLQVGGAYTQDAAIPQPYSGPIGAVLNPLLVKSGAADRQPYLSSDCRACEPVCPVEIELPGLLQRQRESLTPTASWQEQFVFSLWRRLLDHPYLFRAYLRFWHRVRRA